MRVLKLHHPSPLYSVYWQKGEFNIELPDGTFYNKKKHASNIPTYAENDPNYTSSHTIIEKKDGIYYQPCSASSGGGKRPYGEPFLIVPKSQYDKVEYVGEPLVFTKELIADLKEMGIR